MYNYRPLFHLFWSFQQLTVNKYSAKLFIAGFESGTSGVRRDHSANCATTNAWKSLYSGQILAKMKTVFKYSVLEICFFKISAED